MAGERDKPDGAIWRRVRDIAPPHRQMAHDGARQAAIRWRQARLRLEDPSIDRSAMDIWLREQSRAFAIETGQIEGLYQLRRGVTETLITEGFEGVRGAHSVTTISDKTLEGLLTDQEAALAMLHSHVKEERPLTASAIKEWHALVTRHQATASGREPGGNQINVRLRKGEWKERPNNPRRQDGFVHEYCPPMRVQEEMDQFLAFHDGHEGLALAPEVEAAWLHHEFVRIHPFQDGNGRISRMLMAYAYAKAGEFPPVIPAANKLDYIDALEAADGGNFPALVDYMGELAALRSNAAARRAEEIPRGRTHYRHGNGGTTARGVYQPPEAAGGRPPGMTTELHEAARAGEATRITELVGQGADVDARGQHDRTALHEAATDGHGDAIATLTCLGADLDARDRYGRTPLHLAAQFSRSDIITQLILAGADVGARDRNDETPLHEAARWNDDPAVIRTLADHRADSQAQDKDGATALHIAAQWSRKPAVIAALIELGADLDARDKEGQTPLDLARRRGDGKVIEAIEAATNPPAAPPAGPGTEPGGPSTPSM